MIANLWCGQCQAYTDQYWIGVQNPLVWTFKCNKCAGSRNTDIKGIRWKNSELDKETIDLKDQIEEIRDKVIQLSELVEHKDVEKIKEELGL